MDAIHDAASIAERMVTSAADPRAYLLAFYPELAEKVPPLDHVVRTARPMTARVNHGTWIASCECGMRADAEKGAPAPGCVVWLSIPLGFCLRCGNQGTGRGWRPITVPSHSERQRIEAVLTLRPNIGDRNWEPSESIADLLTQSIEHGDPIPEEAA